MPLFPSKKKTTGPQPKLDPRAPPYPGFDQAKYDELRRLVGKARFNMSTRHGYEVTDVDELLDQVAAYLEGSHIGADARDYLLSRLRGVRFHMSRRIGYDVTEVDAFLDQIAGLLA